MNTILIVDDSVTILQTLKQILTPTYKVDLANSGKMALKFIHKKKPDLVLLDLMMPDMDGKQTLIEIKKMYSDDIPIIFLTASNSSSEEVDCLKLGAIDFITKPIIPEVVLIRTSRTLELEAYRKHLQKTIEEKTREIKSLSLQALITIINTVDAKDEYTKGHSLRVAKYSQQLAKRLGMSESQCFEIYEIASLHDVGKIGIPDAILKKQDSLSGEEYEIMKTHTTLGANIVKDLQIIDQIEMGALYHHERYDGTGYPTGLRGEEIPFIARIICVADSFDAMLSNRCYREGQDINRIKNILRECSGTQFDPMITEVFLNMLEHDDETKGWFSR